MRLPDALRKTLLGVALGTISSRPPDLRINNNYVERWMLWPKSHWSSKWRNVYIHRFNGDDEDGALHDHEPDNISLLLQGQYDEHFHTRPLSVEYNYYDSTPKRRYMTHRYLRQEGDIICRLAGTPHRITMVSGPAPITMFLQGPRRRKWGFHCVGGWKPWEQYIGSGDYGNRAGKGCDE